MVALIIQIVAGVAAGIAIGVYAGRAIALFAIASKKAKRARTDMVNAPTWMPSHGWLDHGPIGAFDVRAISHLPADEYLKALDEMKKERAELYERRAKKREDDRRKRRVQKATEYAQALQDRRRAFAWPYWEITSRQAEKREANIILREVIAEQTLRDLEKLRREAEELSKEAS